jgi:hypothetical protein
MSLPRDERNKNFDTMNQLFWNHRPDSGINFTVILYLCTTPAGIAVVATGHTVEFAQAMGMVVEMVGTAVPGPPAV